MQMPRRAMQKNKKINKKIKKKTRIASASSHDWPGSNRQLGPRDRDRERFYAIDKGNTTMKRRRIVPPVDRTGAIADRRSRCHGVAGEVSRKSKPAVSAEYNKR